MKRINKNLLVFCLILIGCTTLYSQNNPTHESSQNDTSLYTSPFIQVPPKFPGNVMKYLADSIRYPEEAKKKNIQGTVYVSFIIEKDGSVSTVKVLRADDEVFINEAKRLISAMPRWSPGKQNGTPVRIQYATRVIFKL